MDRNLDFTFPYDETTSFGNGHYFNQSSLPEEIIIMIFSYVPVSDILKLGLVCKKWYNIIKTHTLWSTLYFRKYREMPKQLPWYTFYALFRTPKYFDGNLLKNNCGQQIFFYWNLLRNGRKFKVERNPVGSDPYPTDCDDFENATSCFVTSYELSEKNQIIQLSGNLIKYIMKKHKPHIYASEWVAGRFDCGGIYNLTVKLCSKSVVHSECSNENETRKEFRYNSNEATKWKKVEVVIEDYKDTISEIIFEHSGIDNQWWSGHYGPKMAGGVVRLLFNSMKPVDIQSASYEID